VKPKYDLNFASGEIIWYEVMGLSFNLILTNLEGIPLATISRYLCVNLLDMSSISVLLCRNCSHWNCDLNVDLLRVNNNKLLEIISEFNLTNVIKEPTRNGALLSPLKVLSVIEETKQSIHHNT
jgi:hypothetical protein